MTWITLFHFCWIVVSLRGYKDKGSISFFPTNSFLKMIPVRGACMCVCVCVYKGIKLTYLKIYFIEVQLIYNVVLISTIQQSDSIIHMYAFCFIFFSIMVYHRILTITPCAIQ